MKTNYDNPGIQQGQRLSAEYLNRLAELVVQRISVVGGGKFSRNGTSMCLDLRGLGGSGSAPFVGKIVTTGPGSAADFTDARYWVQEQSIKYSATGVATLANLAGGRLVCATNIQELGIGTSDLGIHGIIAKDGAARITVPTRYVLVHGVGGGYVFSSPPFIYVEDSYYYDVTGLDEDGCPDAAVWWKGVLPFGMVDYDSEPT